MKDFNKFLEEISLKGNKGIPSNKPGESDYIKDTDKKAKEKFNLTGNEFPRAMSQLGPKIMGLVQKSMSMTNGKEKELEELAEQTIRSVFGTILEDTDLDIKLLKPGKVKEFQDEESEEQDTPPSYKELIDADVKLEVDKSKIANNIIQGEAKNTKHVLHSDIVKDGLDRIFGNKAKEIFDIWDEISKLADKLDWIIPVDVKAHMMEEQPEGMAGAVKVDWKPKEYDAEKVLKSLEEGEELEENEEEIGDMLSGSSTIIKSRGIDFPMLLHETVKGIYELIASVGISSDPKMAEVVKLNVTSAGDEAEDFRYGPQIASDLREFVSINKDVDKYPNIHEFVFGKMIGMPASEFLELMRGILNKTDKARKDIDNIIDDVIKELSEYEIGTHLSEYGDDDDLDSDNGETDDILSRIMKNDEPKEETPIDYSKMSQRDLTNEIDDALDSGDMEKVKHLSQYLTEGKEVYLNELKMINEKSNPHIK